MTHDAASSAGLPPGACDWHFHVFDPAYPLAATASAAAPEFRALRSLMARTLAQAYPQRCLWASNWPHVGRANPPRDADLLTLLRAWAPDSDTFRRILVDNPQQLYGF